MDKVYKIYLGWLKTFFYLLLAFLLLIILIPSSSLNSYELSELALKEVPTSFKGRFRPLEVTARLWLEDYYHRQSIKPQHYQAFHRVGPSALSLLWHLQFQAHYNWDDIPLFWIYSARLKELLDLPVKDNYFTYQQLHQAIYERKKTNLALIKELVTYHFLKAYFEVPNPANREKMELRHLSSGLWATFRKGQVFITDHPKNPPWQYLKAGFMTSDPIEELTSDYVKKHRPLNEEILRILQAVKQFSYLKGPYAEGDNEYQALYRQLTAKNLAPYQIAEFLEQEYPLNQRLAYAGTIFKVLPSKDGEWYSLNTLTMHHYNVEKNLLEPIPNFTLYPNEQFEQLRDLYYKLIKDYNNKEYKQQLAYLLMDNYPILIGQPIQKAWGKSLTYPSIKKLRMEHWYYQLPLIEATIALYSLAIILFSIGLSQKKQKFNKIGSCCTFLAFCLNTLILVLRCLILERPPVSNMFETVIYVPWIAVLTSLVLARKMKNSFIMLSASIVALALIIMIKVTGLGSGLENVQAVLDSHYWLIIHVLMVVGSYGVFALAGVLGQIYLCQYIIHKHETSEMRELGQTILQAIYVGVILLIPGTLLGGVWAAQSWGRFWDWDPKESWAFISSCIYLIFIHAYTFKHIYFFGLAMGSILGLLAISFTWYGVNYILGTGLHSYGFGAGGEIYYYLFILAELFFLIVAGYFHLKAVQVKSFERK
jgi:ABC-type transport system involved in cytochrome c biogenesis permease subunit